MQHPHVVRQPPYMRYPKPRTRCLRAVSGAGCPGVLGFYTFPKVRQKTPTICRFEAFSTRSCIVPLAGRSGILHHLESWLIQPNPRESWIWDRFGHIWNIFKPSGHLWKQFGHLWTPSGQLWKQFGHLWKPSGQLWKLFGQL